MNPTQTTMHYLAPCKKILQDECTQAMISKWALLCTLVYQLSILLMNFIPTLYVIHCEREGVLIEVIKLIGILGLNLVNFSLVFV